MLFQSDPELLGRYVREGCEQSFAALVAAHESMVEGTALRRTGDAELARDVAQQVFVLLARKAAWLVGRDSIAGWLHRAACHMGARARRGEARARASQAEALQHSVAASRSDCASWEPLDEALGALAEKERAALLLRYFEDRSYGEVAARLGLSEAAARQRVSRGLRKLEDGLRRRGVGTPSAALLTAAAAMQSQLTAQAGLATAALAAPPVTVPATFFLTTIMSHTASKVAVATLVLAALPVAVLHEQKSKVLAENRVRAERTVAGILPAQSAAAGPESPARQGELQAAWDRLRAEESRRLAAQEKLAALESAVQRAESEVVVSYGQIEEMAGRAAKSLAGFRHVGKLKAEPDPAKRVLLAQGMEKAVSRLGDVLSMVKEAHKLESDPQKAARFYATLFMEIYGLDASGREALQRIAYDHFSAMRQAGVIDSRRPASPDKSWDDTRMSAFRRLEEGMLDALSPQNRARTKDWEGLIPMFSCGFMSGPRNTGGAK
jgi:RNA polymerase sigma factor (sigma-70 family)